MKTYTKIIAIVAAGLACTALTSSANLVTSGTVYWPQGAGTQPDLQVVYSVNESAALVYTYSYTFSVGDWNGTTFTPTTGNPASSFVIDTPFANAGSLNTFTSTGATAVFTPNNNVTWFYVGGAVNSDTVTFQTLLNPGLGGGSAVDGSPSVSWFAPAGALVATPVPEPTTIAAGALLLLPFGIGALRSLRKDRVS